MNIKKLLTSTVAASLYLIAAQSSANAHIIIENMEGKAGYNDMLTLIIPHGCGLSPTTQVRMKIPDGIKFAVPYKGDGWNVDITKRKIDKPIAGEGGPVTEVPDEIIWKGNSLPSEQLGLFRFMAGLPNTPGKVLYFKTIQVCGDTEERWIDTHDNDEEYWRVWLHKTPAPFAVLVEPDKPQLGVDMQTLQRARAEMSATQ